MDRLASMQTLLAAVETGSLSAASRKLGMPLATVSRKVSELEAHIGTTLLIRTSRHLALTDAGRSYVTACKRILEDVEAAERAAAGEYRSPQGDLVVSSPIVFGRLHILPVVTEFLRTYPGIDIRLDLTDRIVDLAEDHVDVAVRIGELPDSSLLALRVGSVRRLACASPQYLAGRGTPTHPGELAGHDCVTFGVLQSPVSWKFHIGKTMRPFAVHSRLIVGTAEAAIDAARHGTGIVSVLSYQARAAIADGSLVRILDDFEPPAMPVSLIYRGHQHLPIKVRAFVDFAAPRLKPLIAEIGR
jgi:DNA-binding transcriptional LysR family regulator